ncbi:MAG: glycosyltransferase family 2 protein [Actinomycetota bacterium]|nr:glycosyltransferase family 2 protein [Actinomycetota bacterium]
MPTSLALAIPAYNEADGIAEFLHELDECFRDWDGDVTFVVVDDRSTDGTLDVLQRARPTLSAELRLIAMEENSGHGPAVLRAYREAIATGADVTLQVDGDGQFDGRDVRRIADDLSHSGLDVAIAKRRDRCDPWFRKILTRLLRLYLQQRAGLKVMDPNCPLRAYRSPVLEALLTDVPARATVPNVYLAVLGDRAGLGTAELIVEHRDRRGDTAQGTTWGRKQRTLAIPKRLIVFVWRAFHECRRFIRTLEGVRPGSLPAQARGAVPDRP